MESDVEVVAERMVAGGLALCRDADGRIVLVDGALPGERVTVTTHQRHGATHGEVLAVLEAAAGRVTPPCPYVAAGCGGCNWQMCIRDRGYPHQNSKAEQMRRANILKARAGLGQWPHCGRHFNG